MAPFWALGLFLLAGGLVAVAMPLGLATNAGDLEPWERFASVGVGLGVGAGALWWLARSPGTHVQLDLTRRRLRSGQPVLQSELWSHDQAAVEEGVSVVAEACRLPWTKPTGAIARGAV